MGHNLKKLCAYATEDSRAGILAEDRMRDLFARYGEALVEALEYYADPARWGPVTQLVSRPSPEKARALLAAIEKEAAT